ncbi:uncharacterized protein LOC116152736 isoform X2 [Camelus dromedarius]|uniref:uncharacterized protein LOC116152736 isoform X2 n=1 Tax=Camelus dromedarius TaxID=9838 RepID=UPI00126333E7|nr:uncharacterized protein LOC116152736 isoform X2 [Camelus dromedarius]
MGGIPGPTVNMRGKQLKSRKAKYPKSTYVLLNLSGKVVGWPASSLRKPLSSVRWWSSHYGTTGTRLPDPPPSFTTSSPFSAAGRRAVLPQLYSSPPCLTCPPGPPTPSLSMEAGRDAGPEEGKVSPRKKGKSLKRGDGVGQPHLGKTPGESMRVDERKRRPQQEGLLVNTEKSAVTGGQSLRWLQSESEHNRTFLVAEDFRGTGPTLAPAPGRRWHMLNRTYRKTVHRAGNLH